MTESYSPLSVLMKYYTSGVQIPSNFKLINVMLNSTSRYSPNDYDTEIRKWITSMPTGSMFNVVVILYNVK